MLIGLDFDNTLANYDEAFLGAGRDRGILPLGFDGGKAEVRNHLRTQSGGEEVWQGLQGYVYGAGIERATLFSGVDDFMRRARKHQARVVIVSHKTEFGHFDPAQVNLRTAAMGWMRKKSFFDADGFGLSEADVHFKRTREEKIEAIVALKPDVFVDDLSEVLELIPKDIRRVLFGSALIEGVESGPQWRDVTRIVFG